MERSDLTTLSFTHALWGQAQEAIKYCEQALEFDRELGDKRGKVNNLSMLGVVFSILRDEQRAINCVEQAFATAKELSDKE